MPLGAHLDAARPANLAPAAAAASPRPVARLAHAHADVARPPAAAPAVLVAVEVALQARRLEAHVAALREAAARAAAALARLAPRRGRSARARACAGAVGRGEARLAQRAPVPLAGAEGDDSADLEERLANGAGHLGGAEVVRREGIEECEHGYAGGWWFRVEVLQ